jgi:hypothetical protein
MAGSIAGFEFGLWRLLLVFQLGFERGLNPTRRAAELL